MKVAVTARGPECTRVLDPRFGRAKWIVVVDLRTSESQVHDNTVNLTLSQGAGIQTRQNVANLGVDAVNRRDIGDDGVLRHC